MVCISRYIASSAHVALFCSIASTIHHRYYNRPKTFVIERGLIDEYPTLRRAVFTFNPHLLISKIDFFDINK